MSSGIIRFTREITADTGSSMSREWIETNGLGGFASSTIIGLNTRRYHGLLVAATNTAASRLVLLSKLEETVILDGRRFELSANRYPGVIHPHGYKYLDEFRLDPFPVFIYEIDGIRIEKRLFMVHGENTTVLEYELLRGAQCALEIRPLIAFREYHNTTHRNNALNPFVAIEPGMTRVAPYASLPPLYLSHDGGNVVVTGHWYENFEYPEEQNRGLDYREDLFNPFLVTSALTPGEPANLIASTVPHDAGLAPALRRIEVRRRAKIVMAAPSKEPVIQALSAAADQFIVRREDLRTVIAGYHWFSDWGRDTMIALPGLTLVTGRADEAKDILLTCANHLDQGMLPNRFLDAGETPEYNTVDAVLWFFEAVRALVKYTGEYQFVHANLYDKLQGILQWHLRGTRYGIRADQDGLLRAGEAGVQLTWMDAKIADWVVTPRYGKPVEIQALWYNALRVMQNLSDHFGDSVAESSWCELADRARESFNRQFWNQEIGCLFDVVADEGADATVRPNQIFAVSLAHSMLSEDQARCVVNVVEQELLTPMGLRTLSRQDPRYRPRYEGGVRDRDSSYHQGTVWPWLMGPFITAYVRVNGGSDEARRKAGGWLAGFEEHIRLAGLGQISEIADAEEPHTPRGCIAQAWSVAELLRAAIEDVFVSPL